jgi:predicted nuclease with TOPRIM domain
MAQDFEQLLREIFGDSFNRFTQFQTDQMKRLNTKLTELAREALKDELTKLNHEINELRTRVARLEQERAQNASDSLGTSF